MANNPQGTRNQTMIDIKSNNIKGGSRPGAGRKPGSANKKTEAVQMAVKASGLTPLEYMLMVMRDDAGEPRDRLSAAVAAAPYVHAKLSSIELMGNGGGPIEQSLTVTFVGQ